MSYHSVLVRILLDLFFVYVTELQIYLLRRYRHLISVFLNEQDLPKRSLARQMSVTVKHDQKLRIGSLLMTTYEYFLNNHLRALLVLTP